MIDNESKASEARRKGIMTKERATEDFRWAVEYKARIIREMDMDFEFALGAQWTDQEIADLEEQKVLPITINEISPTIDLLYGIESQNRSDLRAYPEGMEDSIESEIVTRLLKQSLSKQAEADYKISEGFTNGNVCGEAWLEPWLDFSKNLITADLRLKVSDHGVFYWDPYAKEYDLSDAMFLSKLTPNLTESQILMLYPEAESQIKKSEGGRLLSGKTGNFMPDGTHRQVQDYGEGDGRSDFQWQREGEKSFDLLEHYYKQFVDAYFVIDRKTGIITRADSEEEAKAYVERATQGEPDTDKTAAVIKRKVPEIRVMVLVGGCDKHIVDEVVGTFPSWEGWPAIPYFPRRSISKLRESKRHLSIQGVTRQLKDLNREKNKRRMASLRHMSQSANSGWLTEQDSWVSRDDVENFGSMPGVNLEYKQGRPKPERIFPMPVSTGHEHLVQAASDDIKRVAGINTDLLAMQEGGSDSGRAIALRQKQGMVMVQRYFDNISRTKKLLARFVLSQLNRIYTVERAMKVCGEAFLQQNFQSPVIQQGIDPATGQPVQVPVIDPNTGQPVMQYDPQKAQQMFLKVLNDKEIPQYDVSIGEVVSRETVQYANYLLLAEMAGQGVPIPPDVLVDESTLPTATKSKIKSAIANAQAQANVNPPKRVKGTKNAKRT